MDVGKEIAAFLQTYGGWGVSVILLGMIFYLYKSMNKLLEKRNDQFIEVLRECTALLQQNNDLNERVETMLRNVAKTMDDVNAALKVNAVLNEQIGKIMRDVERLMERIERALDKN